MADENFKISKDLEEIEELANEFAGSYWNYRWIKIVIETDKYDEEFNPTGEKDQEVYYELHEVYYDNEEKPFMWTEEPVKMYTEDAEELFELIGRMIDAASKRILFIRDEKIEELDEYMDKSEVLKKYRKEN